MSATERRAENNIALKRGRTIDAVSPSHVLRKPNNLRTQKCVQRLQTVTLLDSQRSGRNTPHVNTQFYTHPNPHATGHATVATPHAAMWPATPPHAHASATHVKPRSFIITTSIPPSSKHEALLYLRQSLDMTVVVISIVVRVQWPSRFAKADRPISEGGPSPRDHATVFLLCNRGRDWLPPMMSSCCVWLQPKRYQPSRDDTQVASLWHANKIGATSLLPKRASTHDDGKCVRGNGPMWTPCFGLRRTTLNYCSICVCNIVIGRNFEIMNMTVPSVIQIIMLTVTVICGWRTFD